MNAQKFMELKENYRYIGFRGLAEDESYTVGDTLRKSFNWDYENDITTYGDDEEQQLSGTCTLGMPEFVEFYGDEDEYEEFAELYEALLERTKNAYGGNIVLVAGSGMEHGEDEGEMIIEDAVVVEVL